MEAFSPKEFIRTWRSGFDQSVALMSMQFDAAEKVAANMNGLPSVFHDLSEQKTMPKANNAFWNATMAYSTRMCQIADEAAKAQTELIDTVIPDAPPGFDVGLKALKQVIATAASTQSYMLRAMTTPPTAAEHTETKHHAKHPTTHQAKGKTKRHKRA